MNYNPGDFFMVSPDTEYCGLDFLIKKLGINKFIFFRRHTDDIRKLTDRIWEIKSLCWPIVPVIAVDEEGGRVSRLSHIIGDFPSAMSLAACSDRLIYRTAHFLFSSLRQLGFNLDLMPVLDILSSHKNRCLSTRSYGYGPETVRRCAGLILKAAAGQGISCCYKHFPGLGKTDSDSHFELPFINDKMDEDIAIYKELFGQYRHYPVMIAHSLYRQLSKKISTFSSEIINDLLKEKLGFKGAVISDDLLMGALDTAGPTDMRALKAFEAGIDLLLVCRLDERFFNMYDRFQSSIKHMDNKRLTDSQKRLESILPRPFACNIFDPMKGQLKDSILREISDGLFESALADIKREKISELKSGNIKLFLPEKIHPWSPVIETSTGIGNFKRNRLEVERYDINKGIFITADPGPAISILVTLNPYYCEEYSRSLIKIDNMKINFYIISLGEPHENLFIRNASCIINLYTTNPFVLNNTIERLLQHIEASEQIFYE